MKTQPENTQLVTVVIPCYNYGKYVEKAIKSVLNQTYEKVEVIVINDGSTDDTAEKLLRFKSDERVTIINRENKGVIYTRNEGVQKSSGDFIIQLDADDYLDTKYIEKSLSKMTQENLDIVYTQAKLFGRVEFVTDYPNFDLEILKHDNFIHASSLIRKSVLKGNQYDDYLDKLGYEDWDLFLNLCLDGAKAGLLNEPLLYYRKHIDVKSRADEFQGLFKMSLVRHHIWSKQNSKHPDQFWYFSSQIDQLLETIHLTQKHEEVLRLDTKLQSENKELKQKLHKYERFNIPLRIRRWLRTRVS